jgi:hypothetical protein
VFRCVYGQGALSAGREGAYGPPTGSPGCRFGTPQSRSCSPIRGSSPRSGAIGSKQSLFRMPEEMIRLPSEGDRGFRPHTPVGWQAQAC